MLSNDNNLFMIDETKEQKTRFADVKLELRLEGKDADISDIVEYFRMIKNQQPIWVNNTRFEIDLIDVRGR